MKVLERVRQLIELSASTSENEARNAALQACRLIREHELEVVPRTIEERPKREKRRPQPKSVEVIVTRAAGDVVSSLLRKAIRGR